MIRALTGLEIAESNERKAHLYQSKYLVDNLTAILMDSTFGETGLYEAAARAKAHKIIDWIEFKKSMEANENEAPTSAGHPNG